MSCTSVSFGLLQQRTASLPSVQLNQQASKSASMRPSSSAENTRLAKRRDILLDLLHAAGADQRRSHAAIAQHPGQSHLRQRLPALAGQFVERPHLGKPLLVDVVFLQEAMRLGWRASRRECPADSGRSAVPAPADRRRCRPRLRRPARPAVRSQPSGRTSSTWADESGRACRVRAESSRQPRSVSAL